MIEGVLMNVRYITHDSVRGTQTSYPMVGDFVDFDGDPITYTVLDVTTMEQQSARGEIETVVFATLKKP